MKDAVITSCRVRLRPDPDDLAGHHHWDDSHGAEAGYRQRTVRAPGARHYRRAYLSVLLTVFIVPAAYLLVYGRQEKEPSITPEAVQ